MNKLVFTVAMLCCFPGWAFEPATDLKNATVMDSGHCFDDGVPWQCFALSKGGKKYMVMVDGKGVAKVYEIEAFKPNHKPEEMKTLWQRVDA